MRLATLQFETRLQKCIRMGITIVKIFIWGGLRKFSFMATGDNIFIWGGISKFHLGRYIVGNLALQLSTTFSLGEVYRQIYGGKSGFTAPLMHRR